MDGIAILEGHASGYSLGDQGEGTHLETRAGARPEAVIHTMALASQSMDDWTAPLLIEGGSNSDSSRSSNETVCGTCGA